MVNSGACKPWRSPRILIFPIIWVMVMPNPRVAMARYGPSSRRAGRPSRKPKIGGNKSCHGQGQQKRKVGVGHQGNGSVGANGKKTGMPHGYLSGVTHQEVETDDNDDIDGHVVGHIHIIIFGHKGEDGESDHQNTQPEGDDTGCKELHILIIVPFHVHG